MGTEIVGQGEQGAPVLGQDEFIPGEAVLGADARRRRGGVDDRGVAALGSIVKGASGAGTEQAGRLHDPPGCPGS
ncbi:hypothetical protein ACWGDT_11100 [Streptomyces avermitilis]